MSETGTQPQDLYIYGAGGLGRETVFLVERINRKSPVWNLKGFLDDDPALAGSSAGGFPVYGGMEYLKCLDSGVWLVCAIADAIVRKEKIRQISRFSRVQFATLTDPSVIMPSGTVTGAGSMICAGSLITVNVTAGGHTIICSGCTIGHDARLGDFVTLCPGVHVSGCVKIGPQSEIGTGTQIIQGISIGAGTVTGAGATVIRDLPDNCVAVGTPAVVIKKRQKPGRTEGI